MVKIATEFFNFLIKPQEKFEKRLTTNHKWKLFFTVFIIDFGFAVVAGGFLSFIDEFILELESEKMDDIINNSTVFYIFFLLVIIVPFIEELIFRLYLNYKRNFLFLGFDKIFNNKLREFWSKHFKLCFYFSALLFGLIHATNYSNTSVLFYILIPFIILPQFLGGLAIGYIRLRLGFFWGVLEHAFHNFIIFGIIIFFANTTSLVDTSNLNYELTIEKMELGLAKETKLATYKSEFKIDSIIGINTTVKDLAEILEAKDSVLLKNSNRINIRFMNKSKISTSKAMILEELQKSLND